MSIKSLETLEAWRKSKEFSLRVYREVLSLLPPEEKWNLNQQLRRSSNSIPANIAEGYGRYYYQDNIRFCYIARGSLEETLSHLVIAHEMKFIPKSLFESLDQDGEKLTQLINGYIGYLKRSKQGQNEPGANHTVREDIPRYDVNPLESQKDDSQAPTPE
ncbi:MAG: four helix bundle protein [Anaerolineales bacterium]